MQTANRCIYVVEAWLFASAAIGGMARLALSHLSLLSHSSMEIHVLLVASRGELQQIEDISYRSPELWSFLCNHARSLQLHHLRPPVESQSKVSRLQLAIRNPAAYRCGSWLESGPVKALAERIEATMANFLWAEDLAPATLAQRFTQDMPVIYSHNDWKWRIKRYRSGGKGQRLAKMFDHWVSKRHEEALVRKVHGCISASQSEAAQMIGLGVPHVMYVPTTYDPVRLPECGAVPEVPRIVHLGSMQATANCVGLQRFLEVVWPRVHASGTSPELWVIGDMEGAPDMLHRQLQQPGIVCTGYVEDLDRVLRPYDIHIVPWEHDTGTRTRIPLALNYAQTLVSIRAGAACIAELQHGKNCFLVDTLDQMAEAIAQLNIDTDLRARIARAGRDTFLTCFTREALQSKFDRFIQSIIKS